MPNVKCQIEDIIGILLKNRGIRTKKEKDQFLHPPDPFMLKARDVGIDATSLHAGLTRMQKAIRDKESIVVYADYDADGITAGAILWETLYALGARVMPYIPHRMEEGYGLSQKGLDAVISQYHPSLVITVDHGITAAENVAYARTKGIDVIVTDHHVKPKKLPQCTIIHTTALSGAGVSWFVAKELLSSGMTAHAGLTRGSASSSKAKTDSRLRASLSGGRGNDILELAAIGTIADMVPLIGANRSIVKYGLTALNSTKRIGLNALMADAGLTKGSLSTYDVSHVLAPRLNAMGRLVHAMDALRLLCTHQEDKAGELARKLGLTNKERQQLTADTTVHARDQVRTIRKKTEMKKLLFIADDSYNQGIIGLVAGKLVEEYYRPAIVLSRGELVSKASARSIPGFNIVEAIRTCSDILVDVGGHPMAAGFTVETKHLRVLQDRLEEIAEKNLDEEKLIRVLRIDMEIPLQAATEVLWEKLCEFEPFGLGNPEPVFATHGVTVEDARLVGTDGKHLKLKVVQNDSRNSRLHSQDSGNQMLDAIAFGMGAIYPKLRPDTEIDVAYSIDMNVWNGTRRLQLKIKDIRIKQ
jgi:single-stranded-DNA-specific exonuclease